MTSSFLECDRNQISAINAITGNVIPPGILKPLEATVFSFFNLDLINANTTPTNNNIMEMVATTIN